MSIIDIVDENNNMTGEKMDLKEVLKNNIWHREVAIIVMNTQERVLVQKENSSNLWTVTTGVVESEEGPIFSAVRAINKQFVMKATNSDLKLLKVIKNQDDTNNHFTYYYLLKGDYKLTNLKLKKEDSAKLRFLSFDDIMEKIDLQEDFFENNLKNDFVELLNAYKKRLIENYD